MPVTEEQIRALERYRLNVTLVRQTFHAYWNAHPHPEREGRGDPAEPEFFAWMSMWYSTVWVVWEGCISLGLELNLRPELQEQYRRLLFDFRNKTFHAQRAFPPPAMMRYIEQEHSVSWVYALTSEITIAIHAEARALGMTPNDDGFYL